VRLDVRRLAAVALATGLGLAGLAQLMASPHTAPLFDGVFIEDPYRYVAPQASAAGDPLSAEQTQPVVGGAVPLLAVGTAEVPPQAQIIAQADAFDIPAGTASIRVSIRPSVPTDPQIVGNVYSLSITDQAGVALNLRPGSVVTIVLRSPDPNVVAQIARFDGTTWVPLQTENGGLPDLFSANITEVGDYAVLLTGAATSSPPQPSGSTATPTPVPSGGSGTDGGEGAPNWVVIVFVVAAIGVGLGWGVLGGGERR
jgi:hypothetical protein